jgi:hypothetical protein
MIPICSATYFPIPDSVLYPLMEQCWMARNEPRARWGAAFDKIMEVYILFKHFTSRKDCQFSDAHYFSPHHFVLMLKMCTANGALEEFKILNRDIMTIEKYDDEYVTKIKQGYSSFISQRSDLEQKVEPLRISVSLTPEKIQLLKSLLFTCLE